ncbi:hypothetical protein D3C75_636380 [compost metagenome]
MLQPGDPAALHAFAQVLVVHVLHGDFGVRRVGGPQRGAQIGGHAGGAGLRRVAAGIALELGEQVAAPCLVAVVGDAMADREGIVATLEAEALDVVDAGLAELQLDHQLVLAVDQAVLLLRRAVQRTTTGTGIRTVADQTALGDIGTLGTVVEQRERHVAVLQATRVGRQRQLHHVATLRIDGQLQYIGFHLNQRTAAGGNLAGRFDLLAAGAGHIGVDAGIALDIGCRQCRSGSGGHGRRRHLRLSVVLVPLQNHQIRHDCQSDDQYRALNVHDFIRPSMRVGTCGRLAPGHNHRHARGGSVTADAGSASHHEQSHAC